MVILYLTQDPDGIVIKSDDPVIGNQGSAEIFLGSCHDYSHNPLPPRAGDRLMYYLVEENGSFTSHVSDWVVDRIEKLTRERVEDDKLVIAWCKKIQTAKTSLGVCN